MRQREYGAAVRSFQAAADSLAGAKHLQEKVGTNVSIEYIMPVLLCCQDKCQLAASLQACVTKFSGRQSASAPQSALVPARPRAVDPRLAGVVEVVLTQDRGRIAVAGSTIAVGTVLAVDPGLGSWH